MKLNEKAMLVSLSIRSWDAKRTDKKATRELAHTHKVAESRLGVRKEAIDTNAPSYKELKQAIGDMRAQHYELTLPWGRDGAQILTTMAFEDYTAKMRVCQDRIKKAVAAFAADFPALQAQAKIDLNGLYNLADYPTNIKAKFNAEFVISPIPDAEDFRVSLSDDAVDDIKRQITESNEKIVADAMRSAYERLATHIERMTEKLADPDGIFRDTLVTGLVDLCQLLPKLNLTNDPQLEDLRKRAERMIQGVTPEELRTDKKVRRSVAKQAREIQSVMAAFMGTANTEEEAA